MARPKSTFDMSVTLNTAPLSTASDIPSGGAAQTISDLAAALKPFAEHGAVLRRGNRKGAARQQAYEHGNHVLTLGDFDRARLLIEKLEAGNAG